MDINTYVVRNFIASIINKAITDWDKHPELREEIREFFVSVWGEELCGMIDLRSKEILQRIESGKVNYTVLDDEEEGE